jgi:hypothetical protein
MNFIDAKHRDSFLFVKYSKSYFEFVRKVDSDVEFGLTIEHTVGEFTFGNQIQNLEYLSI